MSQSLFSVSLYDTLGPQAVEYIAKHASLACIATSLPHIPALLRLKPSLPLLKTIISLDPLDAGEQPGCSKLDLLSSLGQDLGVKIYSMSQVEAIGESLGPVKLNPPSPDDLVTLNYTSGTTGTPKGVTVTHEGIASLAATLGAEEKTIVDELISVQGSPVDIGGYYHGIRRFLTYR